jgi:hypothetical protein
MNNMPPAINRVYENEERSFEYIMENINNANQQTINIDLNGFLKMINSLIDFLKVTKVGANNR